MIQTSSTHKEPLWLQWSLPAPQLVHHCTSSLGPNASWIHPLFWFPKQISNYFLVLTSASQPLSVHRIKPKFLDRLTKHLPRVGWALPHLPTWPLYPYTAFNMLAATISDSFTAALRFRSELFALPSMIFSYLLLRRFVRSSLKHHFFREAVPRPG